MTTPASAHLSIAFCSARDRKVPVLARLPRRDDHQSPRELLGCLDYGVRCTGWLCPLFPLPTLPPEELLEEAARSRSGVSGAQAILERARREGRELREQEARRRSGRGRPDHSSSERTPN